jgi:choline dehydrogenase-like flavoprotein
VRVVVCGAGTAGCVVAARLSQDPVLEVTLVEVGLPARRWPPSLSHGPGAGQVPQSWVSLMIRCELAAHRARAAGGW